MTLDCIFLSVGQRLLFSRRSLAESVVPNTYPGKADELSSPGCNQPSAWPAEALGRGELEGADGDWCSRHLGWGAPGSERVQTLWVETKAASVLVALSTLCVQRGMYLLVFLP